MKIVLIFLFSLPLLSFQSETTYQCKSLYRINSDDNSHYTLSTQEQNSSRFEFVISKDFTSLRCSDGMEYAFKKRSLDRYLFVKKLHLSGKTLYFKLQLSKESLIKSVYASGYGNLIHEYVVCVRKEE